MVLRRPRRVERVLNVDEQRFSSGVRLIPGIDLGIPEIPGPAPQPAAPQPALTVDVVRARDLVALTVDVHECDLVSTPTGPVLRPREGAEARLVVRFPYQHLAERALYETPAPVPDQNRPNAPPTADPRPVDPPDARPVAPIDALPAKATRLVFAVPAGRDIPFSTEGILGALGRMALVVHPLATPRRPGSLQPGEGPIIHLPGGLVGILSGNGLFVSPAGRSQVVPDPGTVTGLGILARDLRRARTSLAVTAGTAVDRRGQLVDVPTGPVDVNVGGIVHRVPGLFGEGGQVVIQGPPGRIGGRIRRRPVLSRPPQPMETSIEAPFRLVVSPSAQAGWSHATAPVAAEGADHRVELWHTRLGVRSEAGEGTEVTVDEKRADQRIIRALWARDREAVPDWETNEAAATAHLDVPFRTSLDGGDRHMLVRQSAETWLGVGNAPIDPAPVDARSLWLSSLGAWLDLHGQWTSDPYSEAHLASILSWDHVAPVGRDQFVRVVYPGYLFPFGHRAALVKLTERKMKDAAPSVAGLYQRKFLVIGEPVKTYDDRRLPITEVRVEPLVTPTIDDPGNAQNTFFWPTIGGARFRFVLHCRDQEGRPVRLNPALIWVAEQFQDQAAVNNAYRGDPDSSVPADGQRISFAPVIKGGDTMAATAVLRFEGEKEGLRSRPFLRDANVELPAVQALSATGPVTIEYADVYKTNGFGSPTGDPNHPNAGDIWVAVPSKPTLGFGAGQPSGSDKAGGFLQPDLPIEGLSRTAGTVGDIAGMATNNFDPATFLAGALPKLFGLVPLAQLVEAVVGDLDRTPTVISESLDRIEGFLADLQQAKRAAADAVTEAQRLVAQAAGKAAALQQQAADAVDAAQQMRGQVEAAVDQIMATLQGLPNAAQAAVEAAMAAPLDAMRAAVTEMDQAGPKLPPLLRDQLAKLAKVLGTVLAAADLVDDVYRFLNGFDPSSVQARFRYEWRPRLASWPSPANPFLGITSPILEVKDPANGLVLSVDGRASGKGEMRVDVLAELRDFALILLPGEPLVRFDFDHLSFRAGTTGKPDVDVVINEMTFLGILGFVEVLKELIPFDGFSDPPYLDVSPSGIAAGFTLALPNVAVGVFALSNISLGADVQIPFLGKAVTVGFNFCTRERPFTLQVTFLGGGGWFLLRLSPDGLDVLELGLEAGATLSIDFGVASGSVSAMVGVYMRLEGAKGTLAGYLRIRGEVDVLGLISASIELYLELRYEFDTGKLFGKAQLTIEIEVFVFSGSVKITCERQFAGSKGDPTFAQLMAVEPDGTSEPWSEYCSAFAGV